MIPAAGNRPPGRIGRRGAGADYTQEPNTLDRSVTGDAAFHRTANANVANSFEMMEMIDPRSTQICILCHGMYVNIYWHWQQDCHNYHAWRRVHNAYIIEADENMQPIAFEFTPTHWRIVVSRIPNMRAMAILRQPATFRPGAVMTVGQPGDPWYNVTFNDLLVQAMGGVALPRFEPSPIGAAIAATRTTDGTNYFESRHNALTQFVQREAPQAGFFAYNTPLVHLPRQVLENYWNQFHEVIYAQPDLLRRAVRHKVFEDMDPAEEAPHIPDSCQERIRQGYFRTQVVVNNPMEAPTAVIEAFQNHWREYPGLAPLELVVALIRHVITNPNILNDLTAAERGELRNSITP